MLEQQKNALLSQSEYVLSDLLAGIFLYTVAANVVNTVGKESIVELTSEYIEGIKNTRKVIVIDFSPISDLNTTSDNPGIEPCFCKASLIILVFVLLFQDE